MALTPKQQRFVAEYLIDLNGKLVEGQSPKSTDFTLTDLARGSYTLTASVMDAASGESKTTAPVTFYVQQPSLLSPLRRKK